jgi:hypothetical protein
VILVVALFLLLSPEKSVELLKYSIFEEGYSLVVSTGRPLSEPEPPIIIVARQEELKLPMDFEFPEQLVARLNEIDFDNSFLILVKHSFPGRGLVQSIERQDGRVTVTTQDVTVQPGSHVLLGWTQPYEFVLVSKAGTWGEEVHFTIAGETQGEFGETTHYIP